MAYFDTHKRHTIAERKALARANALARCERGHHRMSRTFRPGEQVCTVCELVTYCPACLQQANLTAIVGKKTVSQPCLFHHLAEVQP